MVLQNSNCKLETRKKKKYIKLTIWLVIDIAVAAAVFTLLLHKPARYAPLDTAGTEQQGRVSRYLTYLSSELYNGVQLGEPFELVIIEQGVNEIIANWSAESEGIGFYAPWVLFMPGSIVLMGTANVKGAEFVATIIIEPMIDEKGLLNLHVAKMKVGAMNITPLAKLVAERMYQRWLEEVSVDVEDLRTQIAASLLSARSFEPVFKVDDRKVRMEKIVVTKGKLTARLIPAS
jgi:uncharacterized protein YpmS